MKKVYTFRKNPSESFPKSQRTEEKQEQGNSRNSVPVLAAGVKLNADGRLCLWVFAWILAFGAVYPLNRNKGMAPLFVASIPVV